MRLLSFFMLLTISFSLLANEYVFDNKEEQVAFYQLLKEFRCVTCSNQSLADSKAVVAEAMQDEIYRRFKNHESKDSIKTFMQENYGNYVLYRPPFSKQNAILWLGPFIFLGLGIIGWYKWRK